MIISPLYYMYLYSYGDFKSHCRAYKNKTFITKPESGSQGKGIIVFKNPKEIRAGEHAVVQHYISKVHVASVCHSCVEFATCSNYWFIFLRGKPLILIDTFA